MRLTSLSNAAKNPLFLCIRTLPFCASAGGAASLERLKETSRAASALVATRFFCPALVCCRRAYETGVPTAAPVEVPSMMEEEATEQQPAQDVCVVKALDVFAKSRILNYLSRHLPVKEDNAQKASPFVITKTSDKALYQAEMLLPVEALLSGVMQHTKLRTVGYAQKEKDAVIAACMHAERCLDVLGIPLFTSDRLQRKRAEEAKRDGRFAPMPGDPLQEVRLSDLPFPVWFKAEAGGDARSASAQQASEASYPALRSYQPNYHTTKRRYNEFSQRFGGDPFLRGMAGQLAYLQARIFRHNTQQPGMEDEDEEGASITIDPAEVELLQPSHVLPDPVLRSDATPFSNCPAMLLAVVNSRPLNEHRVAGFIDESEGGVFDLVEGEKGTWWIHDQLPGLVCLFDPFAVKRIDGLYKSQLQVQFDACVETCVEEELTQVDIGFSPNCKKYLKWYTATAPVPHYPALRAVGKALSIEHAVSLCAMHAELLLGFLGIPLSPNVVEQTKHYDACLRHGRLVSPLPRELDDEARSLLPKPLKQWHRIKKTRKRGAPLSVSEKLVALNRRVVADLRQHLIEVDICAQPVYQQLLESSVSAVRQFMVEQRHPYESAYVNYVYAENAQFRCSIYLPLPEVYGVRGGSAIGATPETARKLAALNAVDTLCALNVPVTQNKEKMEQLLALRRQFGLILPRDSGGAREDHHISVHIRSPPAYREAPGCSTTRIPPHQDVWNLIMADASDFDIVKDVEPENCYKLGFPDTGTILRALFQTYLQTVGWARGEQWSYMKHYQGSQHWNGRLRIPCNNYWMELPLDEKKYGRRIALGRCVFRKGAEKAFLIHTFRILHALHLAPWDMYSDATLLGFLRHSQKANIARERRWWAFVASEFLTLPAEGGATATQGSSEVRDAEVFIPVGADLKQILSPNPVMTHELAKKTFV
ncbi:hypothetical protein TraAM80_08633 [Trypanosoma rangeli]|uniref:REH2 DRSM domain-containing protein n=1 Tax=Trypanosoma rangeli TaxID=5698 RepID=A0A3R7M3D8_TRYRA|nr:uncharacterized protein TraAM80_08633 [Trypanosoma rangeli]RNE98672.1 hypothetical protein TraAM80_08633 [Trypanosoma rangeli]|eukprot:RNE98672.1 hypothetical protein TraAM80_08633 [Trypanosoma rangeli]